LKEAYLLAWQQPTSLTNDLTLRVMERVCKEHGIVKRDFRNWQRTAAPNLKQTRQNWQAMKSFLHRNGPSPQRELCEHLKMSRYHLANLRAWGPANGYKPVHAMTKVGIGLLEPLEGDYQELLWEEAIETYCKTYEVVRMTPLLVYMNIPQGARPRVRGVLQEILKRTHARKGDAWVPKVRKKKVHIHEAQIVALLSEGGTWTKHQIAERLDVSTSTAVNKLKRLVEEKRIMAIEAGKGFIYMAL
jgi:DNA-binding MarR family transcriptional regulator